MLGVVTALRLREAGDDVTLYEAAPELGGLASAWTIDLPDGSTVTWDRHYHVTLQSDAATRRVLDRLGLDDEARWAEVRTGYTAGGRIVPANTPIDFLKLPGIGILGKLRVGGTIWYSSRIRDGKRMERVLVDDWLRRWSGRKGFQRFWLPLLRAKLGDNHRVASAGFIWATTQRLYRARRAGVAQDLFGYVPGGYGRVLGAAADLLTGLGVRLRLGARIEAIRRSDAGLVVDAGDDDQETYERVVVTTAAPVASRLCGEELADGERRLLDGVTYQGIVCASLVLRRSLGDEYLTYITDPASPFTAVVEMTALIDPAEVGGHHLVYLPKYVTTDDPLLESSDEEVRAAFLPYLREIHPGFDPEADVLAFKVSRVRYVLAVTTLHYSDHEPPMRTSVPGLWLASSANVVNGTLNVDETVQLAERAVEQILAVPV